MENDGVGGVDGVAVWFDVPFLFWVFIFIFFPLLYSSYFYLFPHFLVDGGFSYFQSLAGKNNVASCSVPSICSVSLPFSSYRPVSNWLNWLNWLNQFSPTVQLMKPVKLAKKKSRNEKQTDGGCTKNANVPIHTRIRTVGHVAKRMQIKLDASINSRRIDMQIGWLQNDVTIGLTL